MVIAFKHNFIVFWHSLGFNSRAFSNICCSLQNNELNTSVSQFSTQITPRSIFFIPRPTTEDFRHLKAFLQASFILLSTKIYKSHFVLSLWSIWNLPRPVTVIRYSKYNNYLCALKYFCFYLEYLAGFKLSKA